MPHPAKKKPFKRWMDKKTYADTLRKNMTPAELALWKLLERKAKDWGVSIKAQEPVIGYVADFLCEDVGLVIEVDGRIHTRKDVRQNDRRRTRHLNNAGYVVVRYTNLQCLKSPHQVIQAIFHAIRQLRTFRNR